jgi:hypothetical protein
MEGLIAILTNPDVQAAIGGAIVTVISVLVGKSKRPAFGGESWKTAKRAKRQIDKLAGGSQ